MSASESQLSYISEKLNIVVGSLIFIMGTLGSCLCLLVFTHRSLITASCSIYFITASLADLVQLFNTLIPRVLTDGFGIEILKNSNIYCKLRNTISQTASLISLTCIILISFDRFAATHRKPKIRHLSSKRISRWLVGTTVLLWLLDSIPLFIYTTLITTPNSNRTICTSRNSTAFFQYQVYFVTTVFYGMLPWLLSAIFGLLILGHIRQTKARIATTHIQPTSFARRVDRHFTRIMLVQVIICVISSVPFAIDVTYSAITYSEQKSIEHLDEENLIAQIIRLLFYLNYASTFWICLSVSSVFRKRFLKRIRQLISVVRHR